jgi:hypothetical protein
MTPLRWTRAFPNSANNFDLLLSDSEQMESKRMEELLNAILQESRRGLTLNSRACKEFRRWFNQPETALKSEAYVLLSNWFMTASGDRRSLVANRCEDLWDALFACRPANRLSSPEPGRNHAMIPAEFQSFWHQLRKVQGESGGEGVEGSQVLETQTSIQKTAAPELSEAPSDKLRARFDMAGVRGEVEGDSRALADFFRTLSRSDASGA